MATMDMEVVTPERKVFSEQVESVIVPATEGYLGVLPNHAPMITGLEIGVIKYNQGGTEKKMAVCGGFMEVINNKVIMLVDTAELSGEIDVMRAKKAKERAEQLLRQKESDVELQRAEMALRRAMARLQAAGK